MTKAFLSKPLIFFLKKTVLAVLDRLVEPHWPHLPEKFEEIQLGEISERIERACKSVLDDPLNYAFFYHVLDADEQGRQPKIDGETVNERFDKKSISCLRYIADSEDKVEYVTFNY